MLYIESMTMTQANDPLDISSLPTVTKGNLSRDLYIAELHLQGKSQEEIAVEMGMSQSSVSRILNSDGCIRYVVEQSTRQIALLAPRVRDNYTKLAQSENENIQHKATQDLSKIIGIMPTHTVNKTVNNILIAQNQELDAEALGVINTLVDAGVIEVDPADVTVIDGDKNYV